jgi:hypothetical protein
LYGTGRGFDSCFRLHIAIPRNNYLKDNTMAGSPYFGFDTTQAKTLENLGVGGENDVTVDVETLQTQVAALNAWATALATKLNADAGVTDTNYDTNPQA